MSGKMSRHSRSERTPPADPPAFSTAKIALGGGAALLLGITLMLFLRFRQLGDDPAVGDPAVASESNAEVPVPSEETSGSGLETATTDEPVVIGDGSDSLPDKGSDVASPPENAAAMTDEINSDYGRSLMAAMSQVGIEVAEFQQDGRGVVTAAVYTGMKTEMERCRLTFRAGTAMPLFQVKLDLRTNDGKQFLWMSAELLADDGKTVRVWARSGTVAELSERALMTGILPPNLDRDIADFFRSLRGDFVEARRQAGI